MSATRSTRLGVFALLLALLLPACIVMDVRANSDGHGFSSVGLIGGYATAGWPADDSILKIGLFEGRSDGTLVYVQVWKLVRVEIGLIGLAVGIGPLDAGIGTLFYKPRPPAYVGDEECGACRGDCDCDDDCCEHGGCKECTSPKAPAAKPATSPGPAPAAPSKP